MLWTAFDEAPLARLPLLVNLKDLVLDLHAAYKHRNHPEYSELMLPTCLSALSALTLKSITSESPLHCDEDMPHPH